MRQTLKLCQIRNCLDGTHEPCPENLIDPCRVYLDVESGRWYYEETASRVIHLKLKDGTTFDVESWLQHQYEDALEKYDRRMVVHDKCVRMPRKPKKSTHASSPKYSAEELDRMADRFIRDRREARDVKNRIKAIGREISHIKRLERQHGKQRAFTEQIELLTEERDELREFQSRFDKNAYRVREYAKRDRVWEKRWQPKRGKTGELVYLYSTNGKMHEINRNGVMIDMEYVYLPEKDMAYFESLAWCEKNLGIKRECWIRTRLDDELIGKPIRHSGKKNANGARIKSLFERKQNSEETLRLKWALFNQGVSMYELTYGEEAKSLYEKKVRPKILRS